MKIKEDSIIPSHSEDDGHIPDGGTPFSLNSLHDILSGKRHSQFKIRRLADRSLLALCIFLIVLAASLLWRTLPFGFTSLNVSILILSFLFLWVATRAAYSLWLMRQTTRFRFQPHRMIIYTLRLNRLTYRRRYWLQFVLCKPHVTDEKRSRWFGLATLRIPPYAMVLVCVAIFAGVSVWFFFDKFQPKETSYVVSNHTAPPIISPLQVPSLIDNASTVHTRSLSKSCKADFNTIDSTTIAAINIENSQVATVAIGEDSVLTIDIENQAKDLFEELAQMAKRGAINVTCNSDFCSSERYYAMLYEDIIGV
ncbi:MAG: hypothetical protein HUK17_03965 [Bacteroidales bacterium]|nr:hypothetical protein [Bacteroidales bacterium]